ncbi:MAG: MerR family transcriptional regulator [Desulfobacterales bacterium]
MDDSLNLSDKLYFRVGEVSEITDIPAYVLRFWETEFKKINPKRTSSGQRLYRRKDVELILEIKHLLYEKKFTIPGARQHLNNTHKKKPGVKSESCSRLLDEIRLELESMRKILE